MIAYRLHQAKYLKNYRVLWNIPPSVHSSRHHLSNNEWQVGKLTSNEYHTFYQQGKGCGGEQESQVMNSWMVKLSTWQRVPCYSITVTQVSLTYSNAVLQHGTNCQHRKFCSQLHLFGYMIAMAHIAAAISTTIIGQSFNTTQQLPRHSLYIHPRHLLTQQLSYTLNCHCHPNLHLTYH